MSNTDRLTWSHYPDEMIISIESIELKMEASNFIYLRLRNQTLKLKMEESVGFPIDFHKLLFDTLKVKIDLGIFSSLMTNSRFIYTIKGVSRLGKLKFNLIS